jgi:hypothetical protein
LGHASEEFDFRRSYGVRLPTTLVIVDQKASR